jgi:MFS family permease
VLARLGFPPIGRHRRFVTAIAIDAVGSGVWMPVSMLYFLAVTPLSLVQVGLAMSIASLLTLPLTLVVGGVVDRYGAKRVLQLGNVLQAIGFAAYPFAHSLPVVVLVVAVAAAGRTAFWGSYAPMVAAISAAGEREKWFGFLGALRNSGFAVASFLLLLGAGQVAAALAIGVVLVAAVVYTLGEMTGGPVLSTLAAESAPVHLRGRFLATYQFSWNAASTVAPVLFAWLLDRGAAPAWLALAGIAVLGAACCLPMHRLLPLAARPVTNAARSPEPVATD